jgi:hypothetical protein
MKHMIIIRDISEVTIIDIENIHMYKDILK